MSQLDNVKRIRAEDFDSKDQELISKLGENLNFFMEEVVNTVNGNLDINNLDREIVQVELTVGANGLPITTTRFSAGTGFRGSKVVSALNLTNVANYVDSAPFITFTPTGTGIYTINHVTGLKTNEKYRILVELIK